MKKELLLDAVYINNGGGKILLDYLIESLEKQNLLVTYLLDERIKNNHPKIKESNTVLYHDASFFKRLHFYKKNRNNFRTIFCFGNIPPLMKCQGKVFTYFHQTLFIDPIPKDFSFTEKLKFELKIATLQYFSSNCTTWVVQNERVKLELARKFNLKQEKIKILPFYPSIKYLGKPIAKIKNSFLYVSGAAPHKNHKNLILAFCDFFDKHKVGQLTVTVNFGFDEVLDLISQKQKQNYPIINVGFLGHVELSKIYAESEFLVFPSCTESFGLGLVEAIENNCNIIASDLAYTHAVCKPSLLFNPFEKDSITEALESALEKTFKKSESVIQNKINEILNLLQNENTK